MPRLLIIGSSTRAERVGSALAEWITEVAGQHGGFDVELVELGDLDLPFMDEPKHPRLRAYQHDHTRAWSAKVDATDAFIFVIPEYNHGMPATIKNALDYLHHEWQYKVAGVVSYGGVSAGTRAGEMLRQVLTTLRMIPVLEAVAVPYVGQVVTERRVNVSQAMTDSATQMLNEMARWAAVLPALRSQKA